MPGIVEVTTWSCEFSEDEISRLKKGHSATSMEDKWCGFYHDNKLAICRSWTGICIYLIEFNFDTNIHTLTINRDKKQHLNPKIERDLELVGRILKRWMDNNGDI